MLLKKSEIIIDYLNLEHKIIFFRRIIKKTPIKRYDYYVGKSNGGKITKRKILSKRDYINNLKKMNVLTKKI